MCLLRSIERILKRISAWATYNNGVAFVRQEEIQVGIDECYHELATCSDRFTVCESSLFLKRYNYIVSR
jgi:hypothetical protein